MTERKRIGLYWTGSCGGCEIAVAEIHERLLDLVSVADIVFWPCLIDVKRDAVRAMPPGRIRTRWRSR